MNDQCKMIAAPEKHFILDTHDMYAGMFEQCSAGISSEIC